MDFKAISSVSRGSPLSSASATATLASASHNFSQPTHFETLYFAIERLKAISKSEATQDLPQSREVSALNGLLQELPEQAVREEQQAKLILRRLAALPAPLYQALQLHRLPRIMPVAQAIKQLGADGFARCVSLCAAVAIQEFDQMHAFLSFSQLGHLEAAVEGAASCIATQEYTREVCFKLHFCQHVAIVYRQHPNQELRRKCHAILEHERIRESPFQEEAEKREKYRRIFQCNSAYLYQQLSQVVGWPRDLSYLVWEYTQEQIDERLSDLELGCEIVLARIEECTAAELYRLVKICEKLKSQRAPFYSFRVSLIVWLLILTLKREAEVKEAAFHLFCAFFELDVPQFNQPAMCLKLARKFQLVIGSITAEPVPQVDFKEIGREIAEAFKTANLHRIWKFQHGSSWALQCAGFLKELSALFRPFPLAELREPQRALTAQHVQAYRDYQFFYHTDTTEIAETVPCLQKRVIQEKSPFAAELLGEMLGSLDLQSQKKIIEEVATGLAISSPGGHLHEHLRVWENVAPEQRQNWNLLLILYIAHYAGYKDVTEVGDLFLAHWFIYFPQYAEFDFFACLQRRLKEICRDAYVLRAKDSKFFADLVKQLEYAAPSDAKMLQEPSVPRRILSEIIGSLNADDYTYFTERTELHAFLDHKALLQLMQRLRAIQTERLAPLKLEEQLRWLGAWVKKCQVPEAERVQWVKAIQIELAALDAHLRTPRYKWVASAALRTFLEELSAELM